MAVDRGSEWIFERQHRVGEVARNVRIEMWLSIDDRGPRFILREKHHPAVAPVGHGQPGLGYAEQDRQRETVGAQTAIVLVRRIEFGLSVDTRRLRLPVREE